MRSRSTGASTVGSWLGRLFRLDFSVLAEVRANPSATSAAIVVVLVASLFAGLGSWLWALQSFVDDRDAFIRSFIVGSLLQTVVWFSWVYVTYVVLTQGYGARQDFGEMTRAMGFAFAPVALSVFIFIGALAVPIGLISFGIAILFTNAAIQEVSDAAVREATIANLAGLGVFALVMGGCANIFETVSIGGLAPGIFFFSLALEGDERRRHDKHLAHARATTFNPFFGPSDFHRLDPTPSGAYSDTHAQFNILPPAANFSPHFGGLITFGDSDIYVADSQGPAPTWDGSNRRLNSVLP